MASYSPSGPLRSAFDPSGLFPLPVSATLPVLGADRLLNRPPKSTDCSRSDRFDHEDRSFDYIAGAYQPFQRAA